MSDISFDTSLFARNDPELARAVEERCNYVGMYGLDAIKIPWAQARAFVQKRGKLYKNMQEWHARTLGNGQDIKHSYHLQALQDMLINAGSYNNFYHTLLTINFDMKINADRLNRVYYGFKNGSLNV